MSPLPMTSPTRTRESLEAFLNDGVIADYESNILVGGLDESDTDTHVSPNRSRAEPNPFP